MDRALGFYGLRWTPGSVPGRYLGAVFLSLFWVLAVLAAPQAKAPKRVSNMEVARLEASAIPVPGRTARSNAVQPGVKAAASAEQELAPHQLNAVAPYLFQGSADARDLAVACLAAAAWYEAGNDPVAQKSVMQVVLNRSRHKAFPKTICGVVFQGSTRKTGCQFTFTCDGSLRRRFPSEATWSAARLRAQASLDGLVDPSVADATHYHADYVSPWWSGKLERLSVVGRHIFYRWRGQGHSLLPVRSTELLDADRAFVASFAGDDLARRPQRNPRTGETLTGAEPEVADADFLPDIALPPVRAVPVAMERPSAIFAQVDSAQPSGRWAVTALNRCAGARGCVVLSYATDDSVARNRALPLPQRERPLFLFARDPASGMDLALWDCTRVERPSASQCLPASDLALRRLMAINSG